MSTIATYLRFDCFQTLMPKKCSWKLTTAMPEWAKETIAWSLAALPALSKLYLCANNRWEEALHSIPLEFFCYGRLELLSISTRLQSRERYTSSLTSILRQNPNIAHLHLESDYGINPQLDLKDVLSQPFPQALKLKNLSLHGNWSIESPSVLAHLKSLSSLEVLQSLGAPNPALWKFLQAHDVRLRDITVSIVNEEFFEYLSSFTGLETLRISTPSVKHQITANQFAKQIYERVIPKHAATLQNVQISSCGSSRKWCFGSWNEHAFDYCAQLRRLEISIHEEDIFETEDSSKHILVRD